MDANSINFQEASTSSDDVNNRQRYSKQLSINLKNLPWKDVAQIKKINNNNTEEYEEYRFLDENGVKVSDTESFVWKWSPDGRYGIDLPGGRDLIKEYMNDTFAVFDLYQMSWSFYEIIGLSFQIPRAAFIYWAQSNIVCAISLVNNDPDSPNEDIQLIFRQSFYKIDHNKKVLSEIRTCNYVTTETVKATLWFHIFENRCGETFVDVDRNRWLIFSNARDCLILIPYIPTDYLNEVQYVCFWMDEIMEKHTGLKLKLDPFISSHFVPWVHNNEINFFINVNSQSGRRDSQSGIRFQVPNDKCGIYQVQFNLADILLKQKDDVYDNSLMEDGAVLLFRKLKFGGPEIQNGVQIQDYKTYAQCGKTVVISKWRHVDVDDDASNRLHTRIGKWSNRPECSTISCCTIDLSDDEVKEFIFPVLITDVIVPHPSESLLMFRYKEDIGMRLCELPLFSPLPLFIKCAQTTIKHTKNKSFWQ